MVALTLVLLWVSARGIAATPPRPVADCAEAQAVDSPCVGVLLPTKDARAGLGCLRADLPACQELSLLRAQELEAELSAAKAHAEAQRKRAEQLSKLLEEAQTPPPPKLEWWQSSEWAVTVAVVAVGALTAAIVLGVTD
jgi:hypothetical protein